MQWTQWSAGVLRSAGISVTEWPVTDTTDIRHMQDRVVDFLAHHEQDSIALNVSGGTRLMSLAAYEAFRALDRPVFYVDATIDRMLWLHPADWCPHELADRIRLPAFLQAHGIAVCDRSPHGVPESRRRLSQHLVDNVEDYFRPLTYVNWAAHTATENLRSAVLDIRPNLVPLLTRFAEEGLFQLEGDRLYFPDEAARAYVNGGWIEEHLYARCLDLKRELANNPKKNIHDVAHGLTVERVGSEGATRNELDVAFLCNNRLHIIECKTRRYPDAAPGSGPAAEALYKLDSLADLLGGLHAHAMLVSYQPFAPQDLTRAQDLGIRICMGKQIQDIDRLLREWVGASPAVSISNGSPKLRLVQ